MVILNHRNQQMLQISVLKFSSGELIIKHFINTMFKFSHFDSLQATDHEVTK